MKSKSYQSTMKQNSPTELSSYSFYNFYDKNAPPNHLDPKSAISPRFSWIFSGESVSFRPVVVHNIQFAVNSYLMLNDVSPYVCPSIPKPIYSNAEFILTWQLTIKYRVFKHRALWGEIVRSVKFLWLIIGLFS